MKKPPGRAGYRCDWCTKEFDAYAKVTEHLNSCPVRLSVRAAENRAGRPLTWKETLAFRDQARRELKVKQ